MFVVIWEYSVRAASAESFETLYGAEGAWVQLFRAHAGYHGTELLRGTAPHTWLTIDRWDSEAAYDAALAAAGPRYAELDRLGDALTQQERRIGRFSSC